MIRERQGRKRKRVRVRQLERDRMGVKEMGEIQDEGKTGMREKQG